MPMPTIGLDGEGSFDERGRREEGVERRERLRRPKWLGDKGQGTRDKGGACPDRSVWERREKRKPSKTEVSGDGVVKIYKYK